MTRRKRGKWNKLFYTNKDMLFSLLIVLLTICYDFFSTNKFVLDNAIAITIFIAIFSVNFTVFAISQALVNNYSKIKNKGIKQNIDSMFRAPMKISVFGIMSTLIAIITSFYWIKYLLVFLAFYGIIASYYVFEFVYKLSITKKSE